MVRLYVLEQLDDELQRFFRGAGSFEAGPVSKILCQKKSRRLEQLGATGGTNGGNTIDGGSR